MMTMFILDVEHMFVEIDTKRCVGCGLCEDNHPEIFSMGERFAVIEQPIVPDEDRESVRQTATDCPAEAIVTTEYPKAIV